MDGSHYQILGLSDDCTEHEIKAAWKRAARTTHPDVGGTDEAFRQARLAFEVLSDPTRRLQYDVEQRRAGRAWQQRADQEQTARPSGMGATDIPAWAYQQYTPPAGSPTEGLSFVVNGHGVTVPNTESAHRWWSDVPRSVLRTVRPRDPVFRVPESLGDRLTRESTRVPLESALSGPRWLKLRGWPLAALTAIQTGLAYVAIFARHDAPWLYRFADNAVHTLSFGDKAAYLHPALGPVLAVSAFAMWFWWPIRLLAGLSWSKRGHTTNRGRSVLTVVARVLATAALLVASAFPYIFPYVYLIPITGLAVWAIVKYSLNEDSRTEQARILMAQTVRVEQFYPGNVWWVRDKGRTFAAIILGNDDQAFTLAPVTTDSHVALQSLWDGTTGQYQALSQRVKRHIAWAKLDGAFKATTGQLVRWETIIDENQLVHLYAAITRAGGAQASQAPRRAA
jgi:hypothetical protein